MSDSYLRYASLGSGSSGNATVIVGAYGHLDNRDAYQLLSQLIHSELRSVHAAHLSRETNSPDLVAQMLDELLRPHGVHYTVACQDEGFDWFDVL